MKKLIAVTACALLAATSAFGQSSGMSQQQKEDMARQRPIPGNTNAGGSSAGAPATAAPGASTSGTVGAGGAGGAGAGLAAAPVAVLAEERAAGVADSHPL